MATRVIIGIFCVAFVVVCPRFTVAADEVAAARTKLARLENIQRRAPGAVSEQQFVDAKIDVIEAELDLALDSGNGTINPSVIGLAKRIVELEEKQLRREEVLLTKQIITRPEYTYRLTRTTLAKTFLARLQNNHAEAMRLMNALVEHCRKELADFKGLRANRIVTEEEVERQESALGGAEVTLMNALVESFRIQARTASTDREVNMGKLLANSERWLGRTKGVPLQ